MSVPATFQKGVPATFKRLFKRFLVTHWNVARTSCLERRRNNAPARHPCAFLGPIGHVDMLAGGHTRTRVSTFSLIAANACRNCEVGVRSRSASTARTADCWCRCASSSHLTRRAPGRDSVWPTTKPWYLPSSSTT